MASSANMSMEGPRKGIEEGISELSLNKLGSGSPLEDGLEGSSIARQKARLAKLLEGLECINGTCFYSAAPDFDLRLKEYFEPQDEEDEFSDDTLAWTKYYEIGKDQEVYYIYISNDFSDDSECINILKEIGCGSSFLRRSRDIPNLFYAKLKREEANTLKSLNKAIYRMFPASYLVVEE